jgi:ankyrin repeat protein
LPPYLIPNSPEENFWRQEHPEGYQRHGEYKETFQTGSTVAHAAAQTGNLHALSKILEKKPTLVSAQDENGWTPLHEGARGGHMEIVQLLYEKGAKINLRSDGGRGGTSLFYAKERHGENHPVVKFLVYVGGLELGPEL